ncbi:MAG: hypothetical protein QGH15_13615 [Kiritimatiellia bacterium]|nr:hypothetical protein [Kiritimatiellia bacterium]
MSKKRIGDRVFWVSLAATDKYEFLRYTDGDTHGEQQLRRWGGRCACRDDETVRSRLQVRGPLLSN